MQRRNNTIYESDLTQLAPEDNDNKNEKNGDDGTDHEALLIHPEVVTRIYGQHGLASNWKFAK